MTTFSPLQIAAIHSYVSMVNVYLWMSEVGIFQQFSQLLLHPLITSVTTKSMYVLPKLPSFYTHLVAHPSAFAIGLFLSLWCFS